MPAPTTTTGMTQAAIMRAIRCLTDMAEATDIATTVNTAEMAMRHVMAAVSAGTSSAEFAQFADNVKLDLSIADS